jgi:polar amino acid transport system substrate-binding protein
MKRTVLIFVILMAWAGYGMALAQKTIVLTVDERYWYPFIYFERGEPKGMHVDLVKKALTSIGYNVMIIPYPKRRCLHVVKNGVVDGMLSISYHPDLVDGMHFPRDAATHKESKYRIMQMDHVVVSTDKKYEFDGNMASLPEPVRLPRGEPIALELKAAGKRVDVASTDLQNFRKLLRDIYGVVITTSIIAEKMNLDPAMAGKLHISAKPMASRSYFLTFSHKSSLTKEERKEIWNEVKRWREDYVYMLQLFSQY